MFHVDNNSGVSAMPPAGAVQSSAPRWFTEGGGGTPASYPGAAWFNIIQAELLNLLSAYGVAPDKADLTQLKKAIEAAIADKATAASVLLTAIAALNTSADKMPYFNGKDSVAMTNLTVFARTLLGRADAAAILSDLGLGNLGSAAGRNVGTGENQLPDMSSFTLTGQGSDNLLAKGPNGLIMQVFRRNLPNSTTIGVPSILAVTYPVPFPTSVWGAFATKMTYAQIVTSCESTTKTGFNAVTCLTSGTSPGSNNSDAVFLVLGY
jgi:hypothetical protein